VSLCVFLRRSTIASIKESKKQKDMRNAHKTIHQHHEDDAIVEQESR
jgi:hypothetical protein